MGRAVWIASLVATQIFGVTPVSFAAAAAETENRQPRFKALR